MINWVSLVNLGWYWDEFCVWLVFGVDVGQVGVD